MNREDYIFNMKSFLDSDIFAHKSIEEKDGVFLDVNHPEFVYFKRIDSVREIEPEIEVYDEDDFIIPTIYISDKPRTIHLLGGTKYNSKTWPLKRINDMAGFEYDYAYLHQCSILGREPFCHWPG